MNFLSKWYSSPQLKLHGIVSILGEEVKIEEQAALTEIVSTLLWFSYREGFAPITLSTYYLVFAIVVLPLISRLRLHL